MSFLPLHITVSKKAYILLQNKLEKEFFPKYFLIRLFEGLLSPDVVEIHRLYSNYEKDNHMNSEEHDGAARSVDKYYKRLVKDLKNNKGQKSAAWLSHFIVDCLEPAHQITWRSREARKNKIPKYHKWLEINTMFHKPRKTLEIIDDDMSYKEILMMLSKQISKIELKEHFPHNKNEVIKLYQEKIIPIQVQGVASIWHKAVCEVNEV